MIVISRLVISSEIVHSNQAPQCTKQVPRTVAYIVICCCNERLLKCHGSREIGVPEQKRDIVKARKTLRLRVFDPPRLAPYRLSPWRLPGQYGASSCLMRAFSGFYESPGPPSSGNDRGIAPLHHHAHQNGPLRRCICSPPPPISLL